MPMSFNNDRYFASLRRRIEATERNVQQVVAKYAGEAFSGIVEKTPVDTGRARASWQLIPINPLTYVIRSESTSYIGILEFGGYRGQGSKTQPAPGGEPTMRDYVTIQAPHGMVRVTFMQIGEPFQRELAIAVQTGWRVA